MHKQNRRLHDKLLLQECLHCFDEVNSDEINRLVELEQRQDLVHYDLHSRVDILHQWMVRLLER